MFIVPMSHRATGLNRRFDRLFDAAFDHYSAPAVDADSAGTRSPALDVTETDTAYTVKLDMPGVTKDDIQISVEGRRVTVQAPVRAEAENAEKAEGQRFVHRERDVTQWSRSLRLPVDVDQAESAAKLDLGVLTLTLVKRSAAAASRITVN